MTKTTRCWCGGERLEPFGEGYLECTACGTLAREAMPTRDVTRVRDEQRDLYGREYWFSHQAELGQADLASRSVTDLPERCLYWLSKVLRYQPPPGRCLELGAAHGAMTALAGWAGFEATGLELSPWVARWARSNFGVRMLEGPLEDQSIKPGSFDLILAMDVLEHLPDPLGTMTRAAAGLSEQGTLIIQTPCRPAGRSLAELRDAGHRFQEMLLAEHLFLFTRDAVVELLRRAGLPEVVFEPALFAHYDMFLAAGRRPLEPADDEDVRRRLLGEPRSRLVVALADLRSELEQAVSCNEELSAVLRQADEDSTARRRQVEELEAAYRQADEDRTARQRQVEELEAAYRQADEDRTARQRQVEELEAAYRQADEDRTARQGQVEELEADYRQADEDRTARQRQVGKLEAAYRQADEDRTARQHRIEELDRQLGEIRGESSRIESMVRRQLDELRDEVHGLHLELDRSARDSAQAESRLRGEIGELRGLHRQAVEKGTVLGRQAEDRELRIEATESRLGGLEELHRYLRSLADHLRGSPIYKAMVRLGRWRDHDRRVQQVLDEPFATPVEQPDEAAGTPKPDWTFESYGTRDNHDGAIAIDLTALLPGGENGGAKLVATTLVRGFSRLAPERRFVLLTTAPCYEELTELEGPSVSRLRVSADPGGLARILARPRFALVFCPMTVPPWNDPRAPLLSVIHDLQYLTYPEFFNADARAERDRTFRRAVDWSERVVTVSDYVRECVLSHGAMREDRVVAIHNSLAARFPSAVPDPRAVATRFGLKYGHYFLYPANFWPHKNHRMLLTAFARLRSEGCDAQLVLTGAERPDPAPLLDAVRRMSLEAAVVKAGWVSDAELAALVDGCRAVIFPSLYEGFGMPVIEAMARGRPVACSNVTALPEVAGDAAVLFDPRKPAEITAAMRRLFEEDDLVADLGRRGRERAREIGDVEDMARAYLDQVEATLAAPRSYRDQLAGVYADGWTPGRFVVSHADPGRELELAFDNPRDEGVTVNLRAGDEGHRATLDPGQSLVRRIRLPKQPGCVEIHVAPTFCPAEVDASADERNLGLRLGSCRLFGGGAPDVDLLARMSDD